MLKKTMLLVLAGGALMAFAVPAVAQGNVELTNINGNTVTEGTEITAVSTDLETTTGAATIFCAKVTWHGNVLKNNGLEHVSINNVVATSEGCEVTVSHIPVTITAPALGTITLDTNGGAVSATFRYHFGAPVNLTCHFEGSVKFTFVSGTDVLTVPGSKLTRGAGFPSGCANEGTTHGSFTLENAQGPVTIDKL